MHAPQKPDYPLLTLENFAEYDGWVFGIPTRYGTMPAQWKVSSCYGIKTPAIVIDVCKGVLGFHWTIVGKWKAFWKIRFHLCIDIVAWWRTGNYSYVNRNPFRPPWH